MNSSDIENLDYSYESLSNYEKDDLIEIIQFLHRENDELKNIQRSPEGEPIMTEDEIINDQEEIIS